MVYKGYSGDAAIIIDTSAGKVDLNKTKKERTEEKQLRYAILFNHKLYRIESEKANERLEQLKNQQK